MIDRTRGILCIEFRARYPLIERNICMQTDNPSVSDGCSIYLFIYLFFYSTDWWNSQYVRGPMRNADEADCIYTTIRLKSRSKLVSSTSARWWLDGGLFDETALVSNSGGRMKWSGLGGWKSKGLRLPLSRLVRTEMKRFCSYKSQLKCRFYQSLRIKTDLTCIATEARAI